jgi:Domain of unknown function (DUF4124)
MKMMNYIFMALIALSLSAHAEVFKCKDATGKTLYQQEPCSPGTAAQGVVKVKEMTAYEVDLAKAKLKAWQEQQAIDDVAKKAVEKERQAELERQESLELQRRSVIAQERQAIAGQQQQNYRPIVIPASDFNRYYLNNGLQVPYDRWSSSRYPHHQRRDDWQINQPNRFPAYQTYKDPPPPPFLRPEITGKPYHRSMQPDKYGYQR